MLLLAISRNPKQHRILSLKHSIASVASIFSSTTRARFVARPQSIIPRTIGTTVIEVNLSSVFRLSKLAGKQMIESGRGGKIVNIASLLSFQGGITVPAYAASKGGVAQLTKRSQTSGPNTGST